MTNPKTPKISLLAVLRYMGACVSSQDWARKYGGARFATTWNRCTRADWMRWLLGRLDPTARSGFSPWHTENEIRAAFPAAKVERMIVLYALREGLVQDSDGCEPRAWPDLDVRDMFARPDRWVHGDRDLDLMRLEAERRGIQVPA